MVDRVGDHAKQVIDVDGIDSGLSPSDRPIGLSALTASIMRGMKRFTWNGPQGANSRSTETEKNATQCRSMTSAASFVAG